MKSDDLGLVFERAIPARVSSSVRIVDDPFPEMLFYGTTKTKTGPVTLVWCEEGICYLGLEEKRSIERTRHLFPEAVLKRNDKEAAEKLKGSDVIPVILRGTVFQKKVWEALLHIPCGHVASYAAVAEYIGAPKAVRAVGSAVGSNPVSIFVPCHRVIRSNGDLSNYGWGDAAKVRILKEESKSS